MNKVFITGRLTANPELKQLQSGNEVSNFTVAVDRRAKTGEEKVTDFFNCTAWGKSAEFISNYGAKGRLILVEGRLQNRSYEDKDGIKRFATDVIAEQMEFLDSKKSAGNEEESADSNASGGDKPLSQTSDEDDLPF